MENKKKPNILKRLYNWTLSWADSKWGVAALFVLAFIESSFFPIPPDILLIALCLGRPKRSFYFAMICTAGSVLGGVGGYIIGDFLWHGKLENLFIPAVFSREVFTAVAEAYHAQGFWAVFIGAFTPIPYKVFTVAAGMCKIDLVMFVLASTVGRGLRFFLVGWLIWQFGPPVKVFIDKYFNWLVVAFTVLLIGSFFLIKHVF